MSATKEEQYDIEVIPREVIGEYLVESEYSPGDHYFVDLFGYDGIGFCTCDDFKFRIEPALKAGLIPAKKSCKHIEIAYAHAGRDFVSMLLKKMKKGEFKRKCQQSDCQQPNSKSNSDHSSGTTRQEPNKKKGHP